MRMVEAPSSRRVLRAGGYVGLCAFFGRNHALYNGVAQFFLLLLLWLKRPEKVTFRSFFGWGIGVAAGLTPLLLLFLVAPGFLGSYVGSFTTIFRHGTNLTLPIPWPWQISYHGDSVEVVNRILVSLLFLGIPVTYLVLLAACMARSGEFLQRHAILTGSGAVGLAYVHHAYSRADLSHLAQAIHPFIFAVLGLCLLFRPSKVYLTAGVGLLLVVGVFLVSRATPFYQRLTARLAWERCEAASGVFLPPDLAHSLDGLSRFSQTKIGAEESLFVAPSAPGLYAMLGKRAPVWEIDLIFSESRERQEQMVQTLRKKDVKWAIISNLPLDLRDDLRFSATYPVVWRYLGTKFQTVRGVSLPGGMSLLRRVAATEAGHPPSTSLPSAR
jgi:hypothetical protein